MPANHGAYWQHMTMPRMHHPQGTAACWPCTLQLQAYNDATFRVPDQDGWQPQREPIEDTESCPLDARLTTRLPVQTLAGERCRASPPLTGAGFDAVLGFGGVTCLHTISCILRVLALSLPRCPPLPSPSSHPCPPLLGSPFPLPAASLNCKGYPVQTSSNAGRFVCNYCYFVSLRHCRHGCKPPPPPPQGGEAAGSNCEGGGAAAGEADPDAQLLAVGEAAGARAAGSSQQQVQQASSSCPAGGCATGAAAGEAAAGDAQPSAVGAAGSSAPDAAAGSGCGSGAPPPEEVLPEWAEDGVGGHHHHHHHPRHALFVHVPPFSAVPERVQFDFLLDLLRLLACSVAAAEGAAAGDIAAVDAAPAQAAAGEPALCEAVAKTEAAAVEGAAAEPEQGEQAPTCSAPSGPMQQARWWAALLGCRVQ